MDDTAHAQETGRSVPILLALLGLAALVRWLRWQAVAVMFNDGPVFLALARAISEGSAQQALSHPFHPLYSALVAAARPFFGGWEQAAVLVSIACGTGAVAALYFFVRWTHGEAAARIAAFLFAVHPAAIEYTGDIQSEGSYLLMLLLSAGFLWRGLRDRRPALALLGGVFSGLAYLARPEGLGIGLAVGALCGFEALRHRLSWRRAIALGLSIAGGMAAVALPYVVFLRVELGEWTLTQKKSVAVISGLEAPPRDGPDPVVPSRSGAGQTAERRVEPRQLPGHPAVAPPTKPARTAGERLTEATFDLLRTHLRSLRYEGAAFLVLGLALTGLRPIGLRGRFVAAILLLYGVVLFGLAANVGYLSGRHALPALLLLLGYVAQGVLVVAERIARGRGEAWRRAAILLALTLFAGIGLGKALRPDRTDSAAERRAAAWLASQGGELRGVAARKRRIAYYADAPHVKIHPEVRSAHKLWVAGASHVVLDGDPRHYPELRKVIDQEARLLHRITEPEPGASVYELVLPPRFRSERYRELNLTDPDDVD